MTRTRVVAFAALVMSMQACLWTSPAPKDVVLRSVHGENAIVHLARVNASGELLTVNDSSIVLLTNARVVVVPLAAVRLIEFGPMSTFSTYNGSVAADDQAKVLQRSRFPYGITNDAMKALLQAAGQTQPDVVAPRQ